MLGLQTTLTQSYQTLFVIFRGSPYDSVKIGQGTLTVFPNHNGIHLDNLNTIDVYQVYSRGKEFYVTAHILAFILKRNCFFLIKKITWRYTT